MKSTRDKILAGARDEFAATGYRSASTNRIVSAAGVSKGLLFSYFGTKEELYLTILLGELERFVRAVAEEPLTGTDPVARFEQTVGAAFAWYNGNRASFSLMMSATDLDRPLQDRLLKRLASAGLPDLIRRVVEDVDPSSLRFTASELAQVLTLLLNGIKQTIAANVRAHTSVSDLERIFRSEMELAVRLLRQGIYRGGEP